MDAPIAALLQDLSSQGMLDETMVVLTTEFGRTPKINGRGGRDHFPKAFSIMMAGGGVQGGKVIGKTDAAASNIETESYEPKDLHTTVAHALGLPTEKRIHAMGGRPFFVGDRGKVIKEAFSFFDKASNDTVFQEEVDHLEPSIWHLLETCFFR